MKINIFKLIKKFFIISLLSCTLIYAYELDKSQFENFTKHRFLLKEYIEVIHSQDRNTLLSFFPQVEERYYRIDDYSEDFIEHTWTDFAYEFMISFWIDDSFYYLQKEKFMISIGDNDIDRFEISGMQIMDNKLLFSVKNIRKRQTDALIDMPRFDLNETYSFLFIFDGDYVDFYINDNFIHKFCRINQKSLNQYRNLIHTNTCDLSKVTWPRHADGTSEYDDKIIVPEPIKLFENEAKTETE